jgi:predicted transcriptional regulator
MNTEVRGGKPRKPAILSQIEKNIEKNPVVAQIGIEDADRLCSGGLEPAIFFCGDPATCRP